MSRKHLHPTFMKKVVFHLDCKYCGRHLCSRGMKANLVADTKVELYSTDCPPPESVDQVGAGYSTGSCSCKIKDAACLGCGNIVGYHVMFPCQPCLKSCNNGHFWMFFNNTVEPRERLNNADCHILVWAELAECDEDWTLGGDLFMEECCR